jgi:hypothetical protein
VGASVASAATPSLDVGERAQQRGVVLLVGGLLARESRRAHAGAPFQCVHLEPGVVGQREHCRGAGNGDRLLQRVSLEGRRVFFDVRHRAEHVGDADHVGVEAGEQLAELGDLPVVRGGDDELGPRGGARLHPHAAGTRSACKLTPAPASTCR